MDSQLPTRKMFPENETDSVKESIAFFRTHVHAQTWRDNGELEVREYPKALKHLQRVMTQLSYDTSAKQVKVSRDMRLAALSKLFGHELASTKDLLVAELRVMYRSLINGANKDEFLNTYFKLTQEDNQ